MVKGFGLGVMVFCLGGRVCCAMGEALGCFWDWLYLCFLRFGAYLFFMVFSVGKSKV